MPVNRDDLFVNYAVARVISQYGKDLVFPNGVRRALGYEALLSLSTCYFGLENRERPVFELGLKRYGNTLKHVRDVLREPSQHDFVDLLESISLLCMVEVGATFFFFFFFSICRSSAYDVH